MSPIDAATAATSARRCSPRGYGLENILMRVVMRYLYGLAPDHPSHRYLLLETADECRHSAMFGEYVGRAGFNCLCYGDVAVVLKSAGDTNLLVLGMNHEESVRWNGWSGELGYRLLGRAYGVLRVWSGVGSGSAGRLETPSFSFGGRRLGYPDRPGPAWYWRKALRRERRHPVDSDADIRAAGIGAEPANCGRPQPTGGGRGDGFGPRRRGSHTPSPTHSSRTRRCAARRWLAPPVPPQLEAPGLVAGPA